MIPRQYVDGDGGVCGAGWRRLARSWIRWRFPKGAAVAVLGDGKLGLLIAQVLHASGLGVRAVRQASRRSCGFRERAGIETRIAGSKLPTAAFDYVVDATGSAEGLREAVAMTRPRGTLIMKSTVHGLVAVDTAPVIVNELTLVGSRCGRMEPALELLGRGAIELEGMVSDRFGLGQAAEAFERAAERGVLKVLVS